MSLALIRARLKEINQCEKCVYSTTNKDEYKEHVERHSMMITKVLICTKCIHGTETVMDFFAAEVWEHPKNFICEKCIQKEKAFNELVSMTHQL